MRAIFLISMIFTSHSAFSIDCSELLQMGKESFDQAAELHTTGHQLFNQAMSFDNGGQRDRACATVAESFKSHVLAKRDYVAGQGYYHWATTLCKEGDAQTASQGFQLCNANLDVVDNNMKIIINWYSQNCLQ